MKRLFLILSVLSLPAFGAPVLNTSCVVAWDYSKEAQERIDGFRFFANDKETTTSPPEARRITCGELKLPEGQIRLHAVAYGGNQVSPPSNTLEFRYSSLPLPAPGRARLVLTFPEAP